MNEAVVLLTCSMARDLDLFAVLAKSVDATAGGDVRHTVIVPGADLPVFARFRSPRREIVAQEDVLPFRVFSLPKALQRLAPLHDAFRRPLYLTGRGQVTRGWMIQQILKIEYARRASAPAVVHVDSDVFFVRPFTADDPLVGGRVRLFRAEGDRLSEGHREWARIAANCLGVGLPDDWSVHYIENCVPWSPVVADAMVKRIEQVHARPYHEVLCSQPTISEYFIYGIFADLLLEPGVLSAGDVSLCHSYWPASADGTFVLDRHLDRIKPWHKALAVQSTHAFSPNERERTFESALARLSTENATL